MNAIIPIDGVMTDVAANFRLTKGSATFTQGNSGVGRVYPGTTAGMDTAAGTANVTTGINSTYTVYCLVATTDVSSGNFIWSFGGNGGTNYMGLRNAGAATSIQPSYGGSTNVTYTGVTNWADGNPHGIATVFYATNDYRTFIDGSQVGATTAGIAFPTGYTWVGLGGLNRNSAELPASSKVYALISFNRALSPNELAELHRNPWQVFDAPARKYWISAASGVVALAGNAHAIASASGALSIQVPIAGAAVAVATATGAFSTSMSLAGAAAAVASASGSLVLGIALSGQALAQVVASGTPGTAFPLAGNAQAVASASGAMSIQVSVSGSAVAQVSASGALSVSGGVNLSGNAVAQATATGALSAAIPLSSAAQVVATATGSLSTGMPLAGAAVAVSTASGNINITVSLSGAAVAQAIAAGGMAIQVPMVGNAVAQASASGLLSGDGSLKSDPRFVVKSIGRNFTIAANKRNFRIAASGRTFRIAA